MSEVKKPARVHPQNQIGIRQLRQDASKILTRVEEGEEFIITNRGVPIARLTPVDKDDETVIQEMIDAGDILEADGNLWELKPPTFVVKGGKSATQQLIEERESYR